MRHDLVAAAESSGCEILEAAFEGGKLQIVLDRPDGVTLEHCEEVSKKISALLDVTDFGGARYFLEVSSPGLDRKLYGPRDFGRFAGQLARVTWIDPERGKRTDVGRLQPLAGEVEAPDRIRLEVEGGEPLDLAVSDISEARLEIEL